MNILVLIKEVPDMRRVKFDRERGVVNRASAAAEINPFDLNVLAAALEQKKRGGCTVTALTMGPPSAKKSLQDAYARGADKAYLMTDRRFGGSDTLATSTALAAGIRKIGGCDLVICGEKSVDGDTAQVGPEVAEILGIPHACYVERIESIDDTAVEVTVSDICGKSQRRRLRLPALISVTKNINTPRLPTVERKLESLEVEVEQLSLDALDGLITEEDTGTKGSATRVKKIEVQAKPERSGKVYKADTRGFMEAFCKEIEVLGIE